MRNLSSIRKISSITSIDNANDIECLHIDGWTVVAKKGQFSAGDLAVFFEIDSVLPATDERYSFLMKGHVKSYPVGDDGYMEGFRLRTVKLRGQLSQGLALPVCQFPEIASDGVTIEPGVDVTEILEIKKYDLPDTSFGSGMCQGKFPWFIPKTDENRIQNIYHKNCDNLKETWFLPTLKLEGSSTTVYCVIDPEYSDDVQSGAEYEVGVCSRNRKLDLEEENNFSRAVKNSGIVDKVVAMSLTLKKSIAVQGETVGPGIQKNHEKFNDHRCFVFSVYLIDDKRYMTGGELMAAVREYGLPATEFYSMQQPFKYPIDRILEISEGESMNSGVVREGLVWKQMDGPFTFKSVSNKFLLKKGGI